LKNKDNIHHTLFIYILHTIYNLKMRLSSSCIESSCSDETKRRRTSQCASASSTPTSRKLAVPNFYDSDDDESDEEEETTLNVGFVVPTHKRRVPAFYDSDDESDDDEEEEDYHLSRDYDSFHHGSPTSTTSLWLSSSPSLQQRSSSHPKSHIKHFVPAFDDDFLSDSADEFMSDAIGLDLDF